MSKNLEREEDQKRKAIFAGNQGISRSVWNEAMTLTRESEAGQKSTKRNFPTPNPTPKRTP